ncbi:hypothetical protein COY27_01705 [Candidatus Woesearchaeota archaeon CG_4_10_14_0_2_um_filter_33_13]|nr:MAG: hypothetical protein COY27_01705 [Candidatus Woesearchaeota archaeon CG_4_10_14_0_2_um_filter_33_13]
MDVERIQKVNNLALDLMRQGLAADREEAVAKAETIFRNRDVDDYAQIRQRMEEVPTIDNPHPAGMNNLSQDQIKDILEKNTAFVIKKFKEFQDKIESLEKDITNLKNRPYATGPARDINTGELKTQSQPAQSQVTQGAAQKQDGSHPRSGNYVDSDVSIEKFFYMGHK